jgi:hypothetical protein
VRPGPEHGSKADGHVPRSLSNRRSFLAGEALLRFPAALETLEADFWQQHNELGGIQDSEVPGGTESPAYTAALSVLDSDMAQNPHTRGCVDGAPGDLRFGV